jgi:hypothetical protein
MEQSNDIGKEVQTQMKMLDETEQRMDKVDGRMKKQTANMKRIT